MKSILTLLKEGCTIKFRSGYILEGYPESSYIGTFIDIDDGRKISDGVRSLDKDGVRLALNDEKNYRNANKELQE